MRKESESVNFVRLSSGSVNDKENIENYFVSKNDSADKKVSDS